MSRILQLNPSQAPAEVGGLFELVKRKTGAVANVIRVLGNSPAALKGFLRMDEALASGALSAGLREQIALAVSEMHGCGYCLSAHTSAGAIAGLNQGEVAAARFAAGADKKSQAVLDLVWAIMLEKGQIDDSDIEAARQSGLSDEEIVEVIANIALTSFTNHLNQVARTVVDCPEVIPGVVSDEALQSALFSIGYPSPT